MRKAKVERDLAVFEESLVDLAERVAAGDHDGLYEDARTDADALCCLLEEIPPQLRPRVLYLVERYQTLLANLVH